MPLVLDQADMWDDEYTDITSGFDEKIGLTRQAWQSKLGSNYVINVYRHDGILMETYTTIYDTNTYHGWKTIYATVKSKRYPSGYFVYKVQEGYYSNHVQVGTHRFYSLLFSESDQPKVVLSRTRRHISKDLLQETTYTPAGNIISTMYKYLGRKHGIFARDDLAHYIMYDHGTMVGHLVDLGVPDPSNITETDKFTLEMQGYYVE